MNIKINNVSNLIHGIFVQVFGKLYGYSLIGLLVQTSHHLSKAALSQNFQELIFAGKLGEATCSEFSRIHFSLAWWNNTGEKEKRLLSFPFSVIMIQIVFIYFASNDRFLPGQELDQTKEVKPMLNVST